MTEELARTKWCPMVRALATKSRDGEIVDCMGGYNKVSIPEGVTLPDSSMCIASDCMMWRELLNTNTCCEGCIHQDSMEECPPCNGSYSGWTGKSSHVGGYCGLAGKL